MGTRLCAPMASSSSKWWGCFCELGYEVSTMWACRVWLGHRQTDRRSQTDGQTHTDTLTDKQILGIWTANRKPHIMTHGKTDRQTDRQPD